VQYFTVRLNGCSYSDYDTKCQYKLMRHIGPLDVPKARNRGWTQEPRDILGDVQLKPRGQALLPTLDLLGGHHTGQKNMGAMGKGRSPALL
jgi:hypothetical protein